MPDWLCPICKAELIGNKIDGVFCRHCGYERPGSEKLEKNKEKKNA